MPFYPKINRNRMALFFVYTSKLYIYMTKITKFIIMSATPSSSK